MSVRNETSALDITVYRAALAAMRNLVAEHIAESLEGSDDAEHRRTMRLVRGLDEAGLNIDNLVEGWLESHDASTLEVWQSPSLRRHPELEPGYDPWAATGEGRAKPAALPERVQRVLVEHLAVMRLDEKTDEVRVRAVTLAHELATAGADLYAAIDGRAKELKPGTPSLRDEPPF